MPKKISHPTLPTSLKSSAQNALLEDLKETSFYFNQSFRDNKIIMIDNMKYYAMKMAMKYLQIRKGDTFPVYLNSNEQKILSAYLTRIMQMQKMPQNVMKLMFSVYSHILFDSHDQLVDLWVSFLKCKTKDSNFKEIIVQMVTLSKEFESFKVESVFFFTSSLYRTMLNLFQCPEIDSQRRNQMRLFISMTFDDAMIRVYQSKHSKAFHQRKWYSEITAANKTNLNPSTLTNDNTNENVDSENYDFVE